MSKIQSVLIPKKIKSKLHAVNFPKTGFTLEESHKWLMDHDYKIPDKVDETINFYRYRQRRPDKRYTYTTEILPNGVELVLMWKKELEGGINKTLWHTIQIKVPKEMVELTKSGKVSIKKTLTKTLNISKSQKTPAIKLIPSNDNKPEIVNEGKDWDIDVLKEQMTKAKALTKKNKDRNIFEPEIKKMINLNKFEGNIIKRARELGEVKNSPVIQNILVKLNEIKQYEVNNTFDPNYNKTLNMMIKKYNDLIDFKVDNYLIPLAEQVRYGKEKNLIFNQIKYIQKLKIKNKQIELPKEQIELPKEIDDKKKILTHYQYMSKLAKYRALEGNLLTQANNDPEKLKELINKYSNKINEYKTLLDEYHPDGAESHIFLYEPEYTSPAGFSKRKAARRNRVKKGGNIDHEELKKFVDAGYKTKSEAENIDGYVLDKELSTKRDKVYFNPETNKAVHTIAGTDKTKDWSNNLLIPLGLHQYSNRYKNAEKIQKEANKKYGKENLSLVSHSQSGNIAQNLAKKKLVGDENITLNPAIIGSHKKNVKVVRSSGDVVSALTIKNKKDKTINTGSYNPLYNHSTEILTKKKKKKYI
jgi:hypothetical protein